MVLGSSCGEGVPACRVLHCPTISPGDAPAASIARRPARCGSFRTRARSARTIRLPATIQKPGRHPARAAAPLAPARAPVPGRHPRAPPPAKRELSEGRRRCATQPTPLGATAPPGAAPLRALAGAPQAACRSPIVRNGRNRDPRASRGGEPCPDPPARGAGTRLARPSPGTSHAMPGICPIRSEAEFRPVPATRPARPGRPAPRRNDAPHRTTRAPAGPRRTVRTGPPPEPGRRRPTATPPGCWANPPAWAIREPCPTPPPRC